MRLFSTILVLIFCTFTCNLFAGESALKPLMAVPGEVVFESDFSKTIPLKKTDWSKRQGTRWEISDGVLQGQPSPVEYQAKKPDHKGLEPRISVLMTPPEFVAKFSVRFLEGDENKIVPFIEFGHHVCRVKLSQKGGAQLLVDHETMLVAGAKEFHYEAGKWIHVLAEMKGDEFVIQFADGPTLYTKQSSFSKAIAGGVTAIGIAGPRAGKVEIDDMTLWTIKDGETQKDWSKKREGFPAVEAVQVKKKKVKKPSKK